MLVAVAEAVLRFFASMAYVAGAIFCGIVLYHAALRAASSKDLAEWLFPLAFLAGTTAFSFGACLPCAPTSAAGVPEADADDLTQETLTVVVREVSRFDRRNLGAFRAWMRGILANRLKGF